MKTQLNKKRYERKKLENHLDPSLTMWVIWSITELTTFYSDI